MYNLIVGAVDGSLAAERLLEVVEGDLETIVGSRAAPNIGRLLSLPTLLIPEVDDSSSDQVAQIGRVTNLFRSGRVYQFIFSRDPSVPAIPSNEIQAAARTLHIGDWDLSRTRWSVKNSDLYQALISEDFLGIPHPTVFKLPTGRPIRLQIAVMMPFAPAFDPVWGKIKEVASESGWPCQRADDIWEDSVVMNDVVALIYRSEVVICDFTGRNANVLYEAGIAHTLGREVIPITQSRSDIPFDISSNRYLEYAADAEGLVNFKKSLHKRLETVLRK